MMISQLKSLFRYQMIHELEDQYYQFLLGDYFKILQYLIFCLPVLLQMGADTSSIGGGGGVAS